MGGYNYYSCSYHNAVPVGEATATPGTSAVAAAMAAAIAAVMGGGGAECAIAPGDA